MVHASKTLVREPKHNRELAFLSEIQFTPVPFTHRTTGRITSRFAVPRFVLLLTLSLYGIGPFCHHSLSLRLKFNSISINFLKTKEEIKVTASVKGACTANEPCLSLSLSLDFCVRRGRQRHIGSTQKQVSHTTYGNRITLRTHFTFFHCFPSNKFSLYVVGHFLSLFVRLSFSLSLSLYSSLFISICAFHPS